MSLLDFNNSLHHKLRAKETTFGFFITLEDPTITEIAADTGVDWVCVDMEHGSLDFRELAGHLRGARGSDLTVLCRLPTTSVDNVKRALDVGAHGVVLPLISTAEQMKEGFLHGRYPPIGARGLSKARANHHLLSIQQYLEVADQQTMIIPIIETGEASRNIDEILAVEGLEAVFFGPADLSASLGYCGVWEGPGVAADILRMNDKAKAKGIATAIMCQDSSNVDLRLEQGFRMLGIGSDVTFVLKYLKDVMTLRKGNKLDLGWTRE